MAGTSKTVAPVCFRVFVGIVLALASSCGPAAAPRPSATKPTATSTISSDRDLSTVMRPEPPLRVFVDGRERGFRPMAIAFWNARRGLIAGEIRCPECPERSFGAIAVTSDGGRTWRPVFRTGKAVLELTVSGASEAWATAGDVRPALFHTTDAGRSWTRMGSSPSSPSFPTPLAGWAVPAGEFRDEGRAGQLARTLDGGRTWTRVRGPCVSYHNAPVSVSFVTSAHGWVLCGGEPGAGAFQFKAVYETTDGGATWIARRRVDLDLPDVGRGGFFPNGMADGIRFLPNGHGWAWTSGGYSDLYGSTDGGTVWRSLWRGRGGGRSSMVDAWFIADDLGFALVWHTPDIARLQVSRDGGDTWEPIRTWRGI